MHGSREFAELVVVNMQTARSSGSERKSLHFIKKCDGICWCGFCQYIIAGVLTSVTSPSTGAMRCTDVPSDLSNP